MSKTTNYNFDKQKWGHQIREDDLNRIAANLDLIDTAIASRPSAATFVIAASDSLHKERADYVCPGVDDQVVIQAVIDALPASGGKISLLEGEFRIGDINIEIKSNVILEGAGKATVLKSIGGGYIFLDNVSHTSVRNLTFDGDRVAAYFIWMQNTSYCDVVHCEYSNTEYDGISIGFYNGNCSNILIRANIGHDFDMHNSCAAVEIMNGANNINVYNNIFYDAQRGISIKGHERALSSDIVIANNIIRHCRGASTASLCGIFVEAENSIIIGNLVSDITEEVGDGICIYKAHGVSCINNRVSNITKNGYFLDQSENILLSNNYAFNAKRGITVFKSSNCMLQSNLCLSNEDYGIDIVTESAKIFVSNNIAYNDGEGKTQNYGLRVSGDAGGYITVKNNNFEFNNITGIFWSGLHADSIVADNLGWKTKNSGSSTGTGAQQTIAHGLAAGTPTKVILWNIEDGANPYQSAAAGVTNIKITAVINQDYGWEAGVE